MSFRHGTLEEGAHLPAAPPGTGGCVCSAPPRGPLWPLDSALSYLQTSSLLASDQHLTADEREYFCREILSFASQQTDSPGETHF